MLSDIGEMTENHREELRKILPELAEIEDQELRDKTAAVWLEALDEGGYELDDLDRFPASLRLADYDLTLVEHTRSVTNAALHGVDAYQQFHPPALNDVTRDYVVSGALLHDVGKILEYDLSSGSITQTEMGQAIRHPILATVLCYRQGLPPEVIHTVALHSHEGDGYDRSPEGLIVYHSDFLNFDTAVRHDTLE